MAVGVRIYTDPACPLSWSIEPSLRRLMIEFGDSLSWTYVMGGLARDYAGDGGTGAVYPGLVAHWMGVAGESAMPFDPRLWLEGPIASTYPSCMAVKAAVEQGEAAGTRYLRALREGLMCFRRKLDTTEALVEEARGAGLDVERFRIDLGSHAIVEAFGNDLEDARTPPEAARAAGAVEAVGTRERVTLPSVAFAAEDGTRRWVFGAQPYDQSAAAAAAAGAAPSGEPAPGVLDALRRFGRMATREVEEVCGLRGPRAHAELWNLATEWQVKPVRVLTGHLWELA
jgi:putative protein-disulfide isomerase